MNYEVIRPMINGYLDDEQYQNIKAFLSQYSEYKDGLKVAYAFIIREMEEFSKQKNEDLYLTFSVTAFPYPTPKRRELPYVYINLPEKISPVTGSRKKKIFDL
jgi:hypothetical protein